MRIYSEAELTALRRVARREWPRADDPAEGGPAQFAGGSYWPKKLHARARELERLVPLYRRAAEALQREIDSGRDGNTKEPLMNDYEKFETLVQRWEGEISEYAQQPTSRGRQGSTLQTLQACAKELRETLNSLTGLDGMSACGTVVAETPEPKKYPDTQHTLRAELGVPQVDAKFETTGADIIEAAMNEWIESWGTEL